MGGIILAACSAPASPSASQVPTTPMPSQPASADPTPSPSAEAVDPTSSASPGWTGHPAEGLAVVHQVAAEDPTTQVFIVEADGSERQVTGLSDALGASHPTWSPDGSQLAFNNAAVGGSSFGQVALVNADGSNERKLAEGRDAQWSPDGSRILFWESDPIGDSETSMFVLDVATETVTEIGLGAAPHWLPDGERISFARTVTAADGSISSALYVMPATGGEAEMIADETTAYWSPDGSAVLLERDGVLSIAATDFSGERDLVNGFSPVWAPDGQSFVFAYDHDADANPVLAVADLDGTALWSGVSGSLPTWSPDGTRLAVEVYRPETPVIQVIEVASGSVVYELEGRQPAWRP
jgi:Tol biopolymer transport system component